MFGATGVWQPRAGVRIVGGCLHMRLRAFGRPPARGAPLRIAHLHTAASEVRFRAMAVAPAGRNTPQQGRRVGQERVGALQEKESQEAEPRQGAWPRDGFTGGPPHGAILPRVWEKTDSPGSPEILLPGSWNHVDEEGTGKWRREADSRFRVAMVPNRTRSADLGRMRRLSAKLKLR
jgi:hypothetical protein